MLSKIVKWLNENNIPNESSNNNLDTDGYTLYRDSVGVVFTTTDGKRYNFRVNEVLSKRTPHKKVYGQGVRLYELIRQEDKWIRNKNTIYTSRDISNFDFIKEWFSKNTNFTPFPS